MYNSYKPLVCLLVLSYFVNFVDVIFVAKLKQLLTSGTFIFSIFLEDDNFGVFGYSDPIRGPKNEDEIYNFSSPIPYGFAIFKYGASVEVNIMCNRANTSSEACFG